MSLFTPKKILLVSCGFVLAMSSFSDAFAVASSGASNTAETRKAKLGFSKVLTSNLPNCVQLPGVGVTPAAPVTKSCIGSFRSPVTVWSIARNSSGVSIIKSNELCLEHDGTYVDGGAVTVAACNGGDNQKWYQSVMPRSTAYSMHVTLRPFVSAGRSLCLSVPSTNEQYPLGTAINLSTCTDNAKNQDILLMPA